MTLTLCSNLGLETLAIHVLHIDKPNMELHEDAFIMQGFFLTYTAQSLGSSYNVL